MAKDRVVLSLDYDGHACVIFKDDMDIAYKKHLQKNIQGMPNRAYKPQLADLLEGARLAFEDYFEAVGANSIPTSAYVGSNRQSQALNRANIGFNRNGDCFRNYETLAAVKGWTLKKLLYADLHNNSGITYAPGTEFDNPKSTLETTFDQTKVEMIRAQLDEVHREHPDETVHFYFSDDDDKEKILPALHAEFGDKYQNIHLHYIKFDWFSLYLKQCSDSKAKVPGADTRGVEEFRQLAREFIVAPYESDFTVTAKPVAEAAKPEETAAFSFPFFSSFAASRSLGLSPAWLYTGVGISPLRGVHGAGLFAAPKPAHQSTKIPAKECDDDTPENSFDLGVD